MILIAIRKKIGCGGHLYVTVRHWSPSVHSVGDDQMVLRPERRTGVPRVVPPAGHELVPQPGEHDVPILVPPVDDVVD